MTRGAFPRACAALALVSAASSDFRVIAQTPQNPVSPPSVTFQTEVNYVDVDAIVTDQQGNFVTGLTRDDFEVAEDGKPQKIDTFTFVDIPLERPDRFLVANRPVTTDVRSNRRAFTGRVYVMVLDDLDVSFMRSPQVRKAAREFVERYFGANDMGSVVYTSGRTDAMQEFTGNPQLLLAAIDKFAGRRLRSPVLEYIDKLYQNQLITAGMTDTSSDPSSNSSNPTSDASIVQNAQTSMQGDDLERQFRATNVLGTMRNLAEFLSTVRGRRKAMLIFSEGIDYTINDVFGIPSDTTIVRATQDTIAAAARANVNFFTVDPRGLVGMTDDYLSLADSLGIAGNPTEPTGDPRMSFGGRQAFLDELRLSQDSLRSLADETGGFATVNRNSFASAFDRIVQANSRYYVMGYYPPSHPRDGRFHKIQVRVKRPGLTVLARKGYASPRGKTPDEKRQDDQAKRLRDSSKGGADSTSQPLREALNSPMQQGGLTFAVQAAPFKGPEKDTSVALAIEIDGDRFQFTPNNNATFSDKVEMSLFSVNEHGKPQTGTRAEVNLTLRSETYQRVKTSGFRLNPRISLAPGRYQVRVGVRESGAGALGSVFYDLQVPDFTKDALMISGLLITASSAETIPTAQADPLVAKMLPGPATSRREFAQSDTLSVLAEIYDNISSQQPRLIDASVRLMDETGRDVFAARDSFQNGSARNWSVYGYTRDIPLKDVAPGRYLLRVEAQLRGNANGAKPVGSETLITVR